MRSHWRRKPLLRIARVLCFLSCLSGPAAGGETLQGKPPARPAHEWKKIHLQLRIAKAKRKADSLWYYRSVARQLKTDEVAIPVSRRKGFNRPASSPPGIR